MGDTFNKNRSSDGPEIESPYEVRRMKQDAWNGSERLLLLLKKNHRIDDVAASRETEPCR